jgi:hypothetical protein
MMELERLEIEVYDCVIVIVGGVGQLRRTQYFCVCGDSRGPATQHYP